MQPHISGFKERALQEQMQSLICYLWDNFIQLCDAENIFLMGVGNAYLGVKVLLLNRGKKVISQPSILQTQANTFCFSDCKSRIDGIVNFVDGNLRPVKSDIDTDLSSWYKDNSRVYVAADHACWSDYELTRKVQKRRFGTVVRSEKRGLNNMMEAHAQEAQEWIMSRIREDEHGDSTEDVEDE